MNRIQAELTLVHPNCGAVYRVAVLEDEIEPTEDCPVCQEVREDWRKSGGLVNRASAGTPLATALGLVVTSGKPGPTQ